MNKDYVFMATAINKDGTDGISYIKDGIVLPVAPVSNKERLGTNPEELFALAWATCLNSALKFVLKSNGLTNESEVRVEVYFKLNREEKRYYFDVKGYVDIKRLTLSEMEPLIEQADYRCPLSQLMAHSKTVSLEAKVF